MNDFICNWCGKKGYGSTSSGPMSASIAPSGWLWNKSFGFGRKVFCSNKCLSDFNSQNSTNNSESDSSSAKKESSKSNYFVESTKSSEQILAEAEAKKVKHQIDMEKKAAREQSDKEFFDSIKKNWKIIITVIVVLIIAFKINTHFEEINAQKASSLSHKLEQIEDKLKIAIQDGDKEKALEYAEQLIHPDHELMTSQKNDIWTGYPYYDEYWSKKREEYKNQIISLSEDTKKE